MRFLPLLLLPLCSCQAYSVLTHEAIIDSVWPTQIRPLLLKRFPGSTPEQLKEAHAYVYGGALIQDLGYAPFGSHTFSNLLHYVRSGDFVAATISQAETLNDYAFALGTLAHYTSDSTGHREINRIEPLIYHKLRRKYGSVVTYEDSPADHLKTEFSLDVIQVSRGLYAPDAFHDFIGFEVAQADLDRAFAATYGFSSTDLFLSEDLAIGTYRFAAGELIPEMTKVAWSSKRKDIEKLSPGIRRSRFVYALPRKEYRRSWSDKYQEPGVFARFLAFLFRLIPTFGPFRPLGFRPVPQQGEQMFLRSFDETLARYRELLNQVGNGNLKLADINLDTGAATQPGQYKLADKTYVWLLDKLSETHFDDLNPALRANLLDYLSKSGAPALSAKSSRELTDLRNAELDLP